MNDSAPNHRIPIPLHIRWRRFQYQLIPVLTVVLCSLIAWRLWTQSPHVTILGQVDVESALVTSSVAGNVVAPGEARHQLYEPVSKGELLARVQTANGSEVEIAAPISGQIVKLHGSKGRHVAAGDPLFTIAADRGRHITTYVRADQRLQPEPGMPVDVQLRSDPSQTFHASVERIGPQYEPIPAAQLRDRKSEEWGLPVVISVPPEAILKPGEFVYIAWRSNSTPATDSQSFGLR